MLEVDGADTALVAGGTLFIGVDGNGILSVTDGGLIVAPDLFIGQMGQVLGNGDLTLSLVNDGLLQPTGVLSIDGSYVQSDLGALAIQLSDVGADLLEVSTVAQISGTLVVTLPEGYVPQVGDRFDILTAQAVVGQFATIEAPEGVSLSVTYGIDAVTVEVVPTTLDAPQLGPAQWSVNP